MSKILHIIRHAKSDWSHECADFDRGLNKRGYADAKLIGQYLAEYNYSIEKVFCSSARRARITLEELNRFLKLPSESIQFIDALYLASRSTLAGFIEQVDNQYNQIAIVGHNPGLTELCYFFTGDYLQNLPTCGVYSIEFNVDDWQAVGCDIGITSQFITPRKLKDG